MLKPLIYGPEALWGGHPGVCKPAVNWAAATDEAGLVPMYARSWEAPC